MADKKVNIEYKVLASGFKKGLQEMTKDMQNLNRQFVLQKEQMKNTASESDKFEKQISDLGLKLEKQQAYTKVATEAYETMRTALGEGATETQRFKKQMLDSQIAEQKYTNGIQSATDKLNKLKESENAAAQEMKKRKDMLKQLGDEQKKLENNEDTIRAKYELSVATLGRYASSSDKLKEKQRYLAEAMTNARDQVANLEKQLELSKSVYGENSKEVNGLEKELMEASVAMQEFANKYADATDKFKQAGEQLSSTGDKFQTVGKALTKGLTVPIAGAGVAVAKLAMDYESAFAGVQKTNDDVVDSNGNVTYSVEQMRGEIVEMSKTLPASAVDIASVAESAGQLGIQADNVLAFSKVMIDLGEATNLGANEAAEQIARFANITKMNQSDFDKFGSTLVALGNNFAATEVEIMAMSMRLAGAGAQVGMSEAQIASFAAGLTSLGVEAEMGGSAFTKIMRQMQLASETGMTAMNQLEDSAKRSGVSLEDVLSAAEAGGKEFQTMAQSMGMSTTSLKEFVKDAEDGEKSIGNFAWVLGITKEEFAELFKSDPAEALAKFIAGLNDTDRLGMSATATLKEMGIEELRLSDTMLRSAGAADVLRDALNQGTSAWVDNAALSEEVEKRYATTESQLKMLRNEVVAVAIEFGGPLLAAIRDTVQASKPLIQSFANMAKSFSEMEEGQQRAILGTIAFVGALGPALTGIGGMLKGAGALSKGISFLGVKLGGIGAGAQVANTAMVGTASTASSTAAAVVSAGTQISGAGAGIGGLTATLGKLSAAFPPVALAAGMTVMAIHDFSKQSLPAVESFADGLDAETKGAIDSFFGLSQGVETALKSLLWSSDAVTEQTKGSIVEKYKQMNEEILQGLKTRQEDERKALMDGVLAKSQMSEEEKQAILSNLDQTYADKQAKVVEGEERINQILQQALESGKGITQANYNEIDRIRRESEAMAIEVLTQSEVEQNVIRDRMRASASLISAQQAAEIVRKSNEAKDGAVKAAEEQYTSTTEALYKLFHETKAIKEEEYNALMAEAEKQKNDTIQKAEETKAGVIAKAREQAEGHTQEVNWETGELLNQWGVFWKRLTEGHERAGKQSSDHMSRANEDISVSFGLMNARVGGTMGAMVADSAKNFAQMAIDASKKGSEAVANSEDSARKIQAAYNNATSKVPKPLLPVIDVMKTAVEGLVGTFIPRFQVSRWMATGGIATGPSVVGIGEAGNEAVIPLEGRYMAPFAKAIADLMPNGGNTAHIVMYNTIENREDADYMFEKVDTWLTRKGFEVEYGKGR